MPWTSWWCSTRTPGEAHRHRGRRPVKGGTHGRDRQAAFVFHGRGGPRAARRGSLDDVDGGPIRDGDAHHFEAPCLAARPTTRMGPPEEGPSEVADSRCRGIGCDVGNGGAAQALHLAAELVVRYKDTARRWAASASIPTFRFSRPARTTTTSRSCSRGRSRRSESPVTWRSRCPPRVAARTC
jgi:hypothetical protein